MYRSTSNPEDEQAAQSSETSAEKLRELAWTEPFLMLLVAQNPAAPASLLDDLLRRDVLAWFRLFRPDASFERELKQHIARNPNASVELLVSLLRFCPKEVQENPCYLLLALESPALQDQQHCQELAFKLEAPEVSLSLLQEAAESIDSTIRCRVAQHKEAPADLLQRLSQDPKESVRTAVAEHPNTPVQALQVLGLDVCNDVRDVIAARDDLSYPMLCSLAGQDPRYLRQLALHPETPEDHLKQLAKDNALLPLVLLHDNVPIDLLYVCAEVPELQKLVAKNPRTPIEVLQILPTSTPMNRVLLENPKLPPDWVGGLLTDGSPEIRAQASTHPNAPAALLQLLRRAGASPTLLQVLPPTEELSQQDFVRLFNRGFFGRLLVASHPKTPAILLTMLFHNEAVEVQLALAKNPSLPEALGERLANDLSNQVRAMFAKVCHSEGLLRRLARDFFTEVRVAVAQNPKTPAPVHLALAKDLSVEVRSALVANPALSAEALQQLSLAPEAVIRRLVVDHFNTDRQTLYALSRDTQRYVSNAAQEKLSPTPLPRDRRVDVLSRRTRPLEAPMEDMWQIAREVLQKRIARYQKKKK